jgi:hypothetical protein
MKDSPTGSQAIEWARLLREFELFEPDAGLSAHDASDFAKSLVEPPPPFVESFLQASPERHSTRGYRIRALYGFLLQKRYEEKLNLLYFAFHIFDEKACLPEEVIDQTPFPHEDGVPAFRYFQDPAFSLDPATS